MTGEKMIDYSEEAEVSQVLTGLLDGEGVGEAALRWKNSHLTAYKVAWPN